MLNIFNYSTDKFPVNYPETIIEKSDGITDAEKYLNELSEKTFLSLWSYPNLYTDQNKKMKHLLVKNYVICWLFLKII